MGVCLLAPLLLAFTTTGGLIKEGNRALENGDPEVALDAYARALERAPGSPEILFNTGLARSASGDPAAAREAFLAALAGGGEALRGPIEYNVGNTYFAEESYHEAVKAYRAALAVDPGDQDAKANLELTLRRIAEQEEKQQQQQSQNQQDQEQGQQDPQSQESRPEQADAQEQPPEDHHDQADSQPPPADPSADTASPEPSPQTDDQGGDQQQAAERPPGEQPSERQPQATQTAEGERGNDDTDGVGQEAAAAAPMDPQQVDQLLDALQSQEEELQQQVRARLVPVAPRTLEHDW